MNVFQSAPALAPETLRFIKRISCLARADKRRAYLVGGFVRDMLLGVKNLDIDVMVESGALEFARYISAVMDAKLVEHKRFGTATLIMKNSVKAAPAKIDIAQARKEFYKRPGALPFVKYGSIKDDLYRRDFTINAMAVSISKDDFGELVDFFGGAEDIAGKRIRALHEKSFSDDPTRIFRAVRFEQRYNFKIDDFTARLIEDAVRTEMPDRVSPERLRNEIELMLKEKDPLRHIKRMRALGALRFISPEIRFTRTEEALCAKIKKAAELSGDFFGSAEMRLVYFMAVIDRLSPGETIKACGRLAMSRRDRKRVISAKESGEKIMAVLSDRRRVAPSAIYRALEHLSREELLFISAKCGSFAKRRIRLFTGRHRAARLLIDGADLKRLGVKPGPRFSGALKKTLYAKIDGLVTTKRQELLFAEKEIRKCSS